MLLADLAHNFCLWVKDELSSQSSKFVPLGILRLVRDVFTISGQIVVDAYGNINRIILNKNDPFACHFRKAIQPFLDEITINLGEI